MSPGIRRAGDRAHVAAALQDERSVTRLEQKHSVFEFPIAESVLDLACIGQGLAAHDGADLCRRSVRSAFASDRPVVV